MRPLLIRVAAMVWLLWAVMPIHAQQHRQLVIFAAASLTDAFEDIATAFETAHPTVEILFNFGGSSTLAAQLNQGAPADIFASANPQQMTKAIDGGRIAGDPQTFAQNRLVLIVPVDNPANIRSIDDLALSGILLVLAAPDVPARVYTDAMLDALAMRTDYGEAYRTSVMENVVSEEPNVRQVAAKIAFGEADAGIVYHSDVTPDIADDVLMLLIPDAVNVTAIYPIAVTDDSPQPELAREFIDFVRAEDGQAILQAWGFLPVPMDDPPVRCMLTRQVD